MPCGDGVAAGLHVLAAHQLEWVPLAVWLPIAAPYAPAAVTGPGAAPAATVTFVPPSVACWGVVDYVAIPGDHDPATRASRRRLAQRPDPWITVLLVPSFALVAQKLAG